MFSDFASDLVPEAAAFEVKEFVEPLKKKKKVSLPSNPWNRKRPIGTGTAAVLFTENNGEVFATQYQTENLLATPILSKPLIFSPDEPSSPIKTRFRDVTKRKVLSPGGTEYNSRRSFNVEYCQEGKKPVQAELRFFSPKKDKTGQKRKEWLLEEDTNLTSEFSKEAPETDRASIMEALMAEMPLFKKAKNKRHGEGECYTIPNKREHNRKLLDANKKVWSGESAEAVTLRFSQKTKEKHDKKELENLQKLAKLFKMEWTHRLGVGISPKAFVPQTQLNMAAGFKVINTWMMTLEDLSSHFAFKELDVVTVEPIFKLIEDSKILLEVSYAVKIKKGDRWVKVSGTLPAIALPNRSNFPRVSDKRLLREVVSALLIGMAPTTSTSFPAPPVIKKSMFSGFMSMLDLSAWLPKGMKFM